VRKFWGCLLSFAKAFISRENWRRFLRYMKTFLTGIVPYFTDDQVEKLRDTWYQVSVLANKLKKPELLQELHDDLRLSADNRRNSMAEIVKRGSIPLTVVGFIVAVVALVGQNARPITQVLTVTSMSTFVLGTIVLLLMNSPKLKIWRRKTDYTPHGQRKLEGVLADLKREDGGDSKELRMVGFDAYLASAFVRHKRDMITLVERRALFVATWLYIVGMICEFTAYLVH